MASTKPLKRKDGSVYAYKITVFMGQMDGKNISRYSTWTIPEELLTSPAKIKKQLNIEAALFEQACRSGTAPAEKKKFKAYAEYVMELKKRDKKISTVERYEELLERIYPEIGFLALAEISPEHLNRLYTKLAQPGVNKKNPRHGLSSKTILEHHRVIHLVFAQAYKEGLVPFNVADRATPPKTTRREAEFFEEGEVIKISEALQSQPLKWRCITMLMIYTGARRGEVMGLKWDCIDYEAGEIKIQRNLQYSPNVGIYVDTPKSGDSRTIAVDSEVLELLRHHQLEQTRQRLKMGIGWKDTGFCFTQEDGEPMHPDSITGWLDEFAKKNDLPHINPHKFRHTHISILLSHGVSVIDAAKRAGHKQPTTTANIYSHVLAKADQKAADVFSSALKTHVG